MKQGTTTTLKINIPEIENIEIVSEIIFSFSDSYKIKADKSNVLMTKNYPTDVTYADGVFAIGLTQEETEELPTTFFVEGQIEYTDKSVVKTDTKKYIMAQTVNTTLVDGNTPSGNDDVDLEMNITDVVEVKVETTDYEDLINKPSINGTTLSGNKTASELDLVDTTEFDSLAEQVEQQGEDIEIIKDDVDQNKSDIVDLQNNKADKTALAQEVLNRANADDILDGKIENVKVSFGNGIEASVNPTTYVCTFNLKNGNTILSTATIDLPLESVVVSGAYDSTTKEVVLTLQNGSTVRFSVADLVSGLVSETTFNSAIANINASLDLKADKSTTYTKTEVDTALADKQDTMSDGNGIDIDGDTINLKISQYAGGSDYLNFNPTDNGLYINYPTLAENSYFREKLTDTTQNKALASKSFVFTEVATKQNVINASNKLDADFLSDGQTNKPSYWNKAPKMYRGFGQPSTTASSYAGIKTGDFYLDEHSAGGNGNLHLYQCTFYYMDSLIWKEVPYTSNINQVPTSTSADEGKFLRVNAQGQAEWQTGGSGGATENIFDTDSENAIANNTLLSVFKTGVLTEYQSSGLPSGKVEPTWEYGTIDGATGQNNGNAPTRTRTRGYVEIGEKLTITTSGNIGFCPLYYGDNHTYLGSTNKYQTTPLEVSGENYKYVRIMLNQGIPDSANTVIDIERVGTGRKIPIQVKAMYSKAEVDTILGNYWLDKTLIFNGDSIPNGETWEGSVNTKYPQIVADNLEMILDNYCKGGTVIASKDNYGGCFATKTEFNNATKDTSKVYDVASENYTTYSYQNGTWATTATARQPLVERISLMSNDADLICIHCGTNDFQYNWTPVGTMADRTNHTFYGALHNTCLQLLDKYLAKQIIFFTPIKRAQSPYTTNESVNDYNKTLKDYCEIIKEVCAYYSIPVVDLYSMSGLNPQLNSQASLFDSYKTHPLQEGHNILGGIVTTSIKSIRNY